MIGFLWSHYRHISKDIWWILPILFVGVLIAEYVNDRQRKKESK
jgi:hypothetical protein